MVERGAELFANFKFSLGGELLVFDLSEDEDRDFCKLVGLGGFGEREHGGLNERDRFDERGEEGERGGAGESGGVGELAEAVTVAGIKGDNSFSLDYKTLPLVYLCQMIVNVVLNDEHHLVRSQISEKHVSIPPTRNIPRCRLGGNFSFLA